MGTAQSWGQFKVGIWTSGLCLERENGTVSTLPLKTCSQAKAKPKPEEGGVHSRLPGSPPFPKPGSTSIGRWLPPTWTQQNGCSSEFLPWKWTVWGGVRTCKDSPRSFQSNCSNNALKCQQGNDWLNLSSFFLIYLLSVLSSPSSIKKIQAVLPCPVPSTFAEVLYYCKVTCETLPLTFIDSESDSFNCFINALAFSGKASTLQRTGHFWLWQWHLSFSNGRAVASRWEVGGCIQCKILILDAVLAE